MGLVFIALCRYMNTIVITAIVKIIHAASFVRTGWSPLNDYKSENDSNNGDYYRLLCYLILIVLSDLLGVL